MPTACAGCAIRARTSPAASDLIMVSSVFFFCESRMPSLRDRARGPHPGDPAEDRARHQAGAARIVEVKQPADKLARRVKAGNRRQIAVEHLSGGRGDAQATEGKGDAAADL